MTRFALMSVLLCFSLCLMASGEDAKTGADDAANKEGDAGKVYVIQTAGGGPDSGGGVVVTKLAVEDFNGIRCFVGFGVDGYMRGVKVRVPVSRILMIMEYKNLEDWQDSVEAYMEELEQ